MPLTDRIRIRPLHLSPPARVAIGLLLVAVMLGIILTVAVALSAVVFAWGLVALAGLVTLCTALCFVVAFVWRRRLTHGTPALRFRPKALIRQHGWRYLLWFVSHALVWLALAWLLSVILIALWGMSPSTLALTAGLFACATGSLLGLLWLRQPLLLGICWQGVGWDKLDGWAQRLTTTLLLRDRHDAAIDHDLNQASSQFRRMVALLDRSDENMTTLVNLSEAGSFMGNWAAEFGRRAQVLVWVGLITTILAWPLFTVTRPWLNQAEAPIALQFNQTFAEEDFAEAIAEMDEEALTEALAGMDEKEIAALLEEAGIELPESSEGDSADSGQQGDSGEGSQGSEGASADSGQPGDSGNGSQGSEGGSADSGQQGDSGNGSQGSEGASTDSGQQGDSSSGSQGSEGASADSGQPGDSGNGSQGSEDGSADSGHQGDSGEGSEGSEGDSADSGQQGDSGEGSEGSEGDSADSGQQGDSGEGSEGSEGDSADSGQQGDSGEGSEGSEGDSADSGQQGNTSDGSERSEGEAADSDQKGDSGEGSQGSEGDSADSGQPGDSGNGSERSEGDSADSGQQGDSGDGSQGSEGDSAESGDGAKSGDGDSQPGPGAQQGPNNSGEPFGLDDGSGSPSQEPTGQTSTVAQPPPVPTGSSQSVDIELPPLKPASGKGGTDPQGTPQPDDATNAPTTDGDFAEQDAAATYNPLPVQRIPNWILALLGLAR